MGEGEGDGCSSGGKGGMSVFWDEELWLGGDSKLMQAVFPLF